MSNNHAMSEDSIRFLTKDNRVITLREFFDNERETRKEQANLPFEGNRRVSSDFKNLLLSGEGKGT